MTKIIRVNAPEAKQRPKKRKFVKKYVKVFTTDFKEQQHKNESN